jgi:hypothetical protein
MSKIVDADIGQSRMRADRAPAIAQQPQRPTGLLAREDVVVRFSVTAPGTDVGEELQRRRAQRQPMFLSLFGVG